MGHNEPGICIGSSSHLLYADLALFTAAVAALAASVAFRSKRGAVGFGMIN